MKKKKIVFLIRDLEYGGAQRQLVTLVKEINSHLLDVTVLYFYAGGALEKILKGSNVPVICLNKKGRWDVVGFLWRLLHILWQIQPDIIHTYMGEANVVGIFLKLFFPSTPIIWGIRISYSPDGAFDWLGNMIGKLETFFSNMVDLIIINSHSGRKDYLNIGFPSEKIVVISNGIDTEYFQPHREAGVKVRQEWGVSDTDILVGLVGRVYPQKDHPNFLKAAALLCQEYEYLRFVCVGSGPDQNYIQQLHHLAEELGIADRLIWSGARGDMCAVHNALDIAVSASAFGEGFGNVIGEAMACGVPCVVTDVGDSAWILKDAGVVVPPGNPEALAAGCRRIITLPLSEKILLKEKARKIILTHFSVKKLVESTQLHCLNLLGA